MDIQNCEFYSEKQCVMQLDGSVKDILNACTKDMVTVPCKGKYCQYKQLNKELDKFQLKYHVLIEESKNKGIVLESVDAKVKVENMKLRECLKEIKEEMEIKIEDKQYEIDHDCFNETRCKALEEFIDFLKEMINKISEVKNDTSTN